LKITKTDTDIALMIELIAVQPVAVKPGKLSGLSMRRLCGQLFLSELGVRVTMGLPNHKEELTRRQPTHNEAAVSGRSVHTGFG
jgi:hypothetical protein